MSSLQQELAQRVTRPVRQRGRDYYLEGRVRELHLGQLEVTALVLGSERYEVSIRRDSGELEVQCSCPYVDGEVCKHVWATALAADNEISGEDAGDCGDGDSSDELDEDFVDEEDWEDGLDAIVGSVVSKVSGQPMGRSAELALAVYERRRWQSLLSSSGLPFRGSDPLTETWYVVQPDTSYFVSRQGVALRLVLCQRRRRKDGSPARPTAIGKVPDRAPSAGVESLVWGLAKASADGSVRLSLPLCREVLPQLSALGRLALARNVRGDDLEPLTWDHGEPWQLVVDLQEKRESGQSRAWLYELHGELSRGQGTGREVLPVSRSIDVFAIGLIAMTGRLGRVRESHATWIKELANGPIRVLPPDVQQLAGSLLASIDGPRLTNPEAAGLSVRRGTVKARLKLNLPSGSRTRVQGSLFLDYDGQEVVGAGGVRVRKAELVLRDFETETRVVETLARLGFSIDVSHGALEPIRPIQVKIEITALAEALAELNDASIAVFVEGQPYRRARSWQTIIESEQDWFNLKGAADFEGEMVDIPDLLKAIRKKERWIRLNDGSVSLLPEDWVARLEQLASLLPPRAKNLRLDATQALMVEGALSGAAELVTDAGFQAAKDRFQRFSGFVALREPRGFRGELRGYQRLALGWLKALDELGFGGCLADDMGLGKTIVVLAWLLRRKKKTPQGAAPRNPSLLVVPRSLLFNWQREAERFAPSLTVLLHHGVDRQVPGAHFTEVDVVLTSYGTLRRDADAFAARRFDYVILDEAHSIKNAGTESHRVARSLSSHGRLALTGTPIENHLGELWNLLGFLNPGVFDGLKHLKKTFETRRPSRVALEQVVLTAVRPFILRRTKSEVAKDLPDRIEKTIQVTLSSAERKAYDDLAEYYRKRLIENRMMARKRRGRGRASDNGREMAQALEALLRLRQAACHPGLLDEQQRDRPSSKLSVLVEHLAALREGGHKALVFSQFTQLLKLLVPWLEEARIPYAYLDGQTRDREAQVERFQEDPDVSVFLISLKAGGVGLNLVAADYVFLLDPWWNPASEAQAIDRTHRIGQERTVIAYRLLARDTVEEKVAALQAQKRELAEALLGDESGLANRLRREDLEALLEI